MKKFVSVFILFVIVFTMSACSQKASDEAVNSTSATTTTTSTTKAETTDVTTKEETTTEQSEQKTTTAGSNTNTANETTTSKKQETTTNANTSSKPQTTTTKPETTTQKPTTTKHDHSGLNGNIGKWFNSRAEVNDYYNSVVDYWVNKEKNGEITFEEMLKNCPDGYECWSCAECGKWTGNFYY